jgi:hypothetical protein
VAEAEDGGKLMAGFFKQVAAALSPIFRPAGTTINGIETGDFASPQQPIRPIMPPGIGIRQWDLTPGLNLQFTPRGDTAVNFAQLRNVANSFDICRLMIETRKDQIVNRPWTIRVKPVESETNKQRVARGASNPNVAKATEILKRPDGIRPFPLWLRMWLDQLLVFDAPCIYPARNVLGDVMDGGLRIISGATITPLVDEQGCIPRPPNPAYQQIILGLPSSNLMGISAAKGKEYTAAQLIYSPRNPRCDSRWGFGPVEQIINTLAIASNWQQSVKLGFTSGNVPEGLMPMPESWTMAQIKDFQNWFDGLLAGNLAKKRRMIAVPDSKRPAQFSKQDFLIDPTINEYLIRVVAFAFSVTPQNLLKQVNKATAKESSDVAQIEGLEPYLKHVETTINMDVLEGVYGITDVEFAYEDEREMDPVKQNQADDVALKNASKTINEVREARGDDPDPNPACSVAHVYTPTGAVPFGQTVTPAADGDGGDTPPKPAAKVRKKAVHAIKGGAMTPTSRYAAGRFAQVASAGLKKLGKIAAKLGAAEFAKVIKVRKSDEDPTPAEVDRVLAAIELDWEPFGKDVTPALRDAALSGVQQGTEQVYAASRGAGTDYVQAAKSHALAYAEDRGAEMVGMKRTEDGSFIENPDARWAIDEPTRNGLRSKIEQAFTDKWSPAKLSDEIENAFDFSEERADMIAKSEITQAQSYGNLSSWIKSGVILTEAWQTSADHDHDDECDDYEDEGEVPVGHQFAPGIFAPGAHPGCECGLVIRKVKE